MKKNVVLIPWIEREEAVNNSGIGRADRTKGYKYGVLEMIVFLKIV